MNEPEGNMIQNWELLNLLELKENFYSKIQKTKNFRILTIFYFSMTSSFMTSFCLIFLISPDIFIFRYRLWPFSLSVFHALSNGTNIFQFWRLFFWLPCNQWRQLPWQRVVTPGLTSQILIFYIQGTIINHKIPLHKLLHTGSFFTT